MHPPISCEFYDQLMVAIQRKIPSLIVYEDNAQQKSVKGVVTELIMIDNVEYLVLKNGQKISLPLIFTFNGKRHRDV